MACITAPRLVAQLAQRLPVAGIVPKRALAVLAFAALAGSLPIAVASAEELPWSKNKTGYQDCSQYGPGCEPSSGDYAPEPPYTPPASKPTYGQQSAQQPAYKPKYRPQAQQPQYGQPGPDRAYDPSLDPSPAVLPGDPSYGGQNQQQPYGNPPVQEQDTFSSDEITSAGHRFFGNVTKGLASVIEYAFQQQGRPNGYILGEEGGGAFVAGLRYGEGVLHTKTAGRRRVYWQGPSIGYDFGAEGSKTMILVYDMYSPDEIFYDYVGVGGQAYLVGGVGITFLKSGHVTMAPIRSGLGLRLGANVGYLKFTRAPTWNPF